MYNKKMKHRRFRQKPYRRSLDATGAGPWLRLGGAVLLLVALALLIVLVVAPCLTRWVKSGLPYPWSVPTPAPTAEPDPTPTPHPVASNPVQRFRLSPETGCARVADPSLADGALLFAAGAAAPVYDRLFRLDLADGTLERIEASPSYDTFRYPVESDRYLAVLDALAGGGGTIRALDKQSGAWKLVKTVAYGHPRLRLEGQYLVWTERTGESESTLYACDLDTLESAAVAVFDAALYGASAPCVTEGRIVYADGTAENGVIHSVWIAGGEPSSFPTGGYVHDPRAIGTHWAWMTGNHDESSDLYLSVNGGSPSCIARGVVDYALADGAAVYGLDEMVFCCLFSDGRTYILSETGARAQFLCAGGGYAVWRDLDSGTRDTLEYMKIG